MKQIPMLDLRCEYEFMKTDIDSAINRCLAHQNWILGPEVKELEEKIAGYLGVKHCIGVSSGTDALVLAMRSLAIKLKGQEYFDRTDLIITTPFTFTATGDAILRSGATPVFVDIDPQTHNIDTVKIREYLSCMVRDNSKVIGIIPVHLYGQACNMDEIMELAAEHNLFVLEDVAQAFGGMWRGRKLGSIGVAGAFSFFPSKNLGGFGDGGMIATQDSEIADLLRMLLKHGGKDKYNVEHIGYNARLDTLQAAVLMVKFKYIEEFNKRRRRLAEAYNTGLANIGGLSLPISSVSAHHVYHQYTVQTPKRDEFQAYLKENGIGSMVYYPVPLHKMQVFNGKMKIMSPLPNTELAAAGVLSLPMEPLQSQADTDYIVTSIRRFFKS